MRQLHILRILLTILSVIPACYPLFADDSLPDLISAVEPSVVKIVTDVSVGSGFVIKDSLIVTNRHVLQNATSATVYFKDGRTFKVEGLVFDGKTLDLCIVRCDGLNGDAAKPLEIAENPSRQGERVFAFGTPRNLEFSVSEGIVSANRVINGQALVQTTAPISAGNSGGPLLSSRDGKLVGINTWARDDGQNLNFAIAASELSHALGKLSARPMPLDLGPAPKPPGVNGNPNPQDHTLTIEKLWEEQRNSESERIQVNLDLLQARSSKATKEGSRAAILVQIAELKHKQRTVGNSLHDELPKLQLDQINQLRLNSYGYIQQNLSVIQVLDEQSCLVLGWNNIFRLDNSNRTPEPL